VSVHYNPTNPNIAVLKTDLGGAQIFVAAAIWFCTALLIILIGIGLLYLYFTSIM
jgi:hypothetical protein